MNHPTEQFDAYIAGALTPDERPLFEQHIAACPQCSAALAAAQAADAAMNRIFTGVQPDADFEERMIETLRRRQRRLVHPLVRKVAVGVAASLLLAAAGYAGSQAMEKGRLPMFAIGSGDRAASRFYEHNVQTDTLLQGVVNMAEAVLSDDTNISASASKGSTGGDALQSAARSARASSNLDNTGLAFHTFAENRNVGAAYRARQAPPPPNVPTYNPPSAPEGVPPASASDGAGAGEHERNSPGITSQREAKYPHLMPSNGSSYSGKPDFAGRSSGDGASRASVRPAFGSVVETNYTFLGGLNDRTNAPGAVVAPTLREAGKKIAHDYFDVAEAEIPAGRGSVNNFAELEKLASPQVTLRKFNPSNDRSPSNDTSVDQLKRADSSHGSYFRRTMGDVKQTADAASKAKDIRDSDDAVTHVEADLKLAEAGKPRVALADAAGDEPAPKPANAPTTPQAENVAPDAQQQVDLSIKPKIIRTGEMEFEVTSFDDSVATVGKIVSEEQGYVSTVNSDKLPNGKVRGSIVLRVPAEHLDTLVLKLRGIGDLHSQHINAQDITKQFTDTDSALRAAKAMQERLLDIIKNGKGAVKDLLEAEKQLGVWREKVEQLEGEIRYYSNQVALSTLTLTLYEKDIRTPALASESETVAMALETEQVEDAYAKAKDAIAQAKGRIITSELKQYDAGQFGGTISAQVPPDAAEAVIGRLKQIEGRVAKFERQRSQTTSNGNNPVDALAIADPIKVKREDVTINLTLYNLANVAPRRTTTITLVAADVEQTYRTLIDQIRSVGGRVLTSQINRGKADEVAGVLNFSVPTEKADLLLNSVRGAGELLKTETTESPDTQNVTESKRGFNLTLGSLPAFAARETQTIQLASAGVPDAFNDLLNTLHEHSARVLTSRLSEQDMTDAGATLEFDLGRDSIGVFEAQLAKDGQVVSRQVNRSTDTDNTVDSKIHMVVTIGASQQLPPRQTTEMSVETPDVQKAMDDLQAAALSAGGRQMDSPAIAQGDNGQTTATMTLDVPMAQIQALIDKADADGHRLSRRTSIDAHAPEGKLARARLTITFATPAALAGNDDSIWAGVRRGLGASLRGLSYSLTLIVIGLCLVAPWVILVMLGWRGVKWFKRGRPAAT